LNTLDKMVREGKIRYLGCSNFSGWHLMKSLSVSERYGWARYVAHQAYYSLVGRSYEWELMPLGLDQKVGGVIWSPLGWARLTGKIRRNEPPTPNSRMGSKAGSDAAPPLDDEYLYKVIDALDEVSAAHRFHGYHRSPKRRTAPAKPRCRRLEPHRRPNDKTQRSQ
jgi:aryl-alcohol dehydrogenase-like predicted oxidoreductase